jgi:hypothetical protein
MITATITGNWNYVLCRLVGEKLGYGGMSKNIISRISNNINDVNFLYINNISKVLDYYILNKSIKNK